jgi:ABC-type oligopeptide transport system ATPase subunit
MKPLLEMVGVSKIYDLENRIIPRMLGRHRPLLAVDNVSFSVPRGGVLGIVGESGSGKSTVARMIMRLETPTAGAIRFNDIDIAHLSGAALTATRKRMQMVFQDPGGSLNPRKPVHRVLRESLSLAGVPHADHAAQSAALLERVGLSRTMLESYPHELSGGQRQRVAIARALAMSPDLIVADEPVSALDVSLQAQIIRLLMRLRDELNLTLVFISHDLALVHHLCSDVVVMQTGRIVERGAPSDVLHRPQHPYTKLLLDAIPHPGFLT